MQDVVAAQKERDDLRAELSELQALERALDSYGAAAAEFGVAAQSEELQSVHAEAAAKAFADYDVNRDGLLERNELAFLSAEMGAPMDAKQLDATLRALNPSATGKVTPAEWRAFWFGAAPAAGGHQDLGLALLRARLFQHKGQKLVAQIGKRRGVHFPDAQALDAKDAKTHVWELSVGEFDAAKVSAHYRAHHNLILDPAMLDADQKYNVFYSFDVKTTGKADFAPYVTQIFHDICNASSHAIVANVTTPRKDVVRISVGISLPFPGDPSSALEQWGLNAELLARVPRFDFELGHTPADVFGAGKYTVADILKVRARAHLHIENALVSSGTAGLRAQQGNRDAQEMADMLPFLGAVDSRVSISAGDVSDVVNALSEYMRTKFGEQSRQMKDLKHFSTLIQEMISAGIRKEALRDRKREFPIALSCTKVVLLTIERDIVELSQLAVWLRSGLGATAELDGVLTARDAMAAINFVEAAAQEVYANPQNAAPATGANKKI